MKKAQAAISSMITIGIIVTALGLSIAGVATIIKSLSFLHQKSEQAFYLAELGIEEGFLSLARNPDYSGTSEPLNIGQGSVTIVVSPEESDKIIRSTGTVFNFVRKIEVRVNINSFGKVTFLSWKEVE